MKRYNGLANKLIKQREGFSMKENEDSLKLWMQILFRFEQDYWKCDLDHQNLFSEAERLHEAFCDRHRADRELIVEVNEIIDAYTSVEEYEKEFQIRLGLLLGLELGGLDLPYAL